MSPYFACAYFDQTYFDTDCAPAGGYRARAVLIRPPAPEPFDNEDDLLMVRLI